MRRIDIIGIGIGIFIAGGVTYLILQLVGLDSINAGIWSQVLLVSSIVGWLFTYLFRVFTKNMTFNQQVEDYEDAFIRKRLEEMTPKQLEELQAEVEAEKQRSAGN